MNNTLALVAVLILVVAGGGAWLFLSGGGGSGLDAAGQTIVTDTAEQRAADSIDKEACRDLLKAINGHPQRGNHAGLNRSEAWLQFALGRSRRALEALEGNLATNAAPEDQELAAQILRVRFHETGQAAIGHRGATFAEDHHAATGAKASLFLAWQLRLRMDEAERAKAHAATLQASFAGTPEARLSKVLAAYPKEREVPAARAELVKLESDFGEIPIEVDLALALFELESAQTIGSALTRTERVLRAFPSSIPARTFKALCLIGRQQYADCIKVLEPLLQRNPKHWRTQMWRSLLDAANFELSKKKNG